MAFAARDIKDRIAVGDDIFVMTDLGGGKVRLMPAPTTITEPGTPINKAFLQPIDNALAGLGTASAEDVGTGAGKVPLTGADGKLPASVIPMYAITEVFVVADTAEMLTLSTVGKDGDIAQKGDEAILADGTTYVLGNDDGTHLTDWILRPTPPTGVISIAGKTGVLGLADIPIAVPTAFSQAAPTGTSDLQTILTYLFGVATGKVKATKLVAANFDDKI
ncbi:MAG: hypothetical protein LBQ40_04440 [Clostridiales bacterium]|jgi:hypothetical protein|nr:hypothetical protein [Clostridiales bacterium]